MGLGGAGLRALACSAPGVKDRRVAYQASHPLVTESWAGDAGDSRGTGTKAEVGIVLNMSPVRPATDSISMRGHARLEDGRLVRWYTDAVFKGQYPSDIVEHLGADAPVVQAGDAALIAQPCDFCRHQLLPSRRCPAAANPASPASSGAAVTDMGWEVAPRSFSDLLLRLKRDYRLPPIYITENGAAYRDQLVDGRIEDEQRRQYIESHLVAVAEAIDHGVDVRGYFVWSLMDNFEWAEGYRKRFGIVHVDYATLRRTLKRSGLRGTGRC